MTMATSSIADYFHGRIAKREYSQAVGCEQIPTYIVDGVPQGWHWVTYKANFTEEVFEFLGVPGDLKDSTDSVTVTDSCGTQYTVSLDRSCTVQGTAMFETESNRVSREKMSPHQWRIIVTHRTGSLVS